MPRFLSPDWVTAFNDAVGGAELGRTGPDVSIAASHGRFRVTQIVHDAPGAGPDGTPGPVRTSLVVDDGRVMLELGHPGDDDARPEATAGPAGRPADVTITLSYADAADLSRGALNPAAALGAGRVKVRGDLSVLVAGQEVLAQAGGLLADLRATTTYG